MKVDRVWLRKASTITTKVDPETEVDWRREYEGSPETIRWFESQLAAGNPWAWCVVTVTVSFQGFEHRETMGASSYDSEKEFVGSGYYDDLVDECVDAIAESFDKLADTHPLWEHDKASCIACIADA